ncbi:branched-chain-amino-acid aminotransferase, cytosolic isoform X1 [Numenius arquata]|uniref:branched-chain-amino-acid aminotransferase, cytosolic isoform X1 n=1 Tax=Numenius arquata TaxID=31919 RepID=UPI003D305429
MLTIEWSLASGWEKPYIKPLGNLSLHPASSSLHYAIELFEGMKAYRGVDGKIRLFRPTLNMDRMARSAIRAALPRFDQNELLECIRKLVEVEKEWVPYSTSASLYIRPTLIGTEVLSRSHSQSHYSTLPNPFFQPSLGVKKPTKALLYVIMSPVGPYFASGSFNPISLWADPKYVRAWKGGTGDCKLGGNYGSSIYAQQEAMELGCQQVLWLYGEDHQITEVGTMNLFLYWINEDGENELATPPLDGIILPGVTRQSILDLAQNWGEFKVSERYITMSDLIAALEENRVKEMFGAGTACIVCPISKILYKGKHLHIPTMENGPQITTRFLNKLSDIQYGREDSDWAVLVS